MRLSDLQPGQTAVILKVLGHGAFRKRVMEMGFVRGKTVEVLLDAPLKDPIKYKIMDYEISLRKSEASMIEIITEQEATQIITIEQAVGEIEHYTIEKVINSSQKHINIALVGNPNCGKTSLFNAACGSHEHVGNYSGVTVDAKKGSFDYKGYNFTIYDLPGTYALSAYTPEEIYVREHLVERTPDVIVNVVVASNLERNLYLTTELIDMDLSMVIALNMYDELENSGSTIDYKALGSMIGVPIVPTVSREKRGLDELFDAVIRVYEDREQTVRHIHINHGPTIEAGIKILKDEIKAEGGVIKHFSPRYLAIKLLEGDKMMLSQDPRYARWAEIRNRESTRIERILNEDMETAMANAKYGFISGALKETYHASEKEQVQTTRIIDSFVTNKLFGFPIFILIMWLMFWATFTLGAYPMQWIESGVAMLASQVETLMPAGALKDLIIDGVIGGVGGVIVFLPNILILYLFISFMEDSGYMARAAFIMDKIMHRIGLHGKSFIPLLMGFGCNVPAIMSSRTIESKSSRIITVLINPFMSCSARLPIYILLVGTFFPSHASLVFMGLYIFGIVLGVITARLLRKFLFKQDETPFVMELPPYRIPTAKATLSHMWEKAAQYLRKMGGLILIASIAVWFLSYYPRAEVGSQADQQRNSYIGQVGQLCEPVVEPLGFNWKVSVALLSGTAAKELIVSTLGVLYSEEDPENMSTLSSRLNDDFSPLSALAFMVFVLLYFPCLASLTAIASETGSWRWAAFSLFYNTFLAWLFALIIFQVGSLLI